ncbi:tetratricopeptide repeat protein [Parafilimonas sp.]|uniref:tetratricopeptide repeat protein n=1 Tax=Parafilimonas sp. TaxID=1969739 RepID=UPI0039E36E13
MMCFAAGIMAQPANNGINKGNEAYRKGDYKTAVEAYKNALRKSPANNTARFNLANALQKQNELGEAGKNYDDVIKDASLNSLKSDANYNKALAYVKAKDLLKAIAAFKESLKENPDDDDARENLQKALNELKQQQQQSRPKNQQQQNQQQQQQQKQKPLNKDMMQQKFNELRNQEKQLQQKLQDKNNTMQPEKDW